MDKDYLDILRKTDLRPGKVKLKEKREELLLEQDRGESDIHAEIIKWTKKNPEASLEDAKGFAKELGIELSELDHHIFMVLSEILSGKLKVKDLKEFKILNELFIKQGEIEAMPSGVGRDMAILRIGMIAELDAASFYERLAELASNKTIKKVMLDVANEEKVHAGEFETLLEEVDPDQEPMEEKGEDEVEDMKK